MTIAFKNNKEFWKKMRNAIETFDSSAKEGTEAAAEQAAQEAMRMTPRDTGALQDSQRVDDVSSDDQFIFKISYNSEGDVPYSIEQHEETSYKHNTANNPPDAQPFFLLKGIRENKIAKIEKIKNMIRWD